jgi:hypothetical protein
VAGEVFYDGTVSSVGAFTILHDKPRDMRMHESRHCLFYFFYFDSFWALETKGAHVALDRIQDTSGLRIVARRIA